MYSENYSSNVLPVNQQDELIPVVSRRLGSWRLSIERQAFNVAELTDRYNHAAQTWQNTLSRLGVIDAYAGLARDTYNRLRLNPSDTALNVLDCGAGTASLSTALAKMYPHQFRFSAVDISPEMVQQARAAFNQAEIEADLRVADIRDLPFADNSQDLVLITHVLEHLADPKPALNEIQRVLKPGGLIMLCCTRPSWSGKWIQMKWRTHTVSSALIQSWLGHHDFEEITPLSIDHRSQLHRLSLAFTACKPEAISAAA